MSIFLYEYIQIFIRVEILRNVTLCIKRWQHFQMWCFEKCRLQVEYFEMAIAGNILYLEVGTQKAS